MMIATPVSSFSDRMDERSASAERSRVSGSCSIRIPAASVTWLVCRVPWTAVASTVASEPLTCRPASWFCSTSEARSTRVERSCALELP
ncbi:hypothetical protein BE20_10400 [Sorangium cellulosum]|nr:hypothetical protein BE20_10400 [Sorangium cellulosum]